MGGGAPDGRESFIFLILILPEFLLILYKKRQVCYNPLC